MIKPIALAISVSIFITSLVFTISSLTNHLEENIITGAVINTVNFTNYSIIFLTVSFVASFLIILSMRK